MCKCITIIICSIHALSYMCVYDVIQTTEFYIHPGKNLSLTTGEIVRSVLTTSQYVKLSNFPDAPLPTEVLELMDHQTTQPSLRPNLHDLLARQNRTVQPILGDGNCFFRAISQVTYSSQEQHKIIRNDIVDYITKNSAKFASLVIRKDTTIEEHIAKCVCQENGQPKLRCKLPQKCTVHRYICTL